MQTVPPLQFQTFPAPIEIPNAQKVVSPVATYRADSSVLTTLPLACLFWWLVFRLMRRVQKNHGMPVIPANSFANGLPALMSALRVGDDADVSHHATILVLADMAVIDVVANLRERN
jgi:hypothetical protein